jgi:hypothetical protein
MARILLRTIWSGGVAGGHSTAANPSRSHEIGFRRRKEKVRMATNNFGTVVGVFSDQMQAKQAVNDLQRAGFRDDQIGFAVRDQTNTIQDTTTPGTTRAGEGAATGVVAGGLLGGLLGAASALLIPGIGPVIAGGILATTLTGAAVGAAAGGVLGALTGMGIPEEEAGFYENEFQSGRTIVTVKAGNRQREALDILRRDGAYDATTRATQGAGYTPGTTMGATGMGSTTTTSTTTGSTYGTYGTTMGSTPGAQGSSARWEDVAPNYRATWQQHTGSSGRWEDYEPYYRYGWETYNNPRYQGRSWREVEPELRRDWESRFPNSPWDQARTTLQENWGSTMQTPGTTPQDYNQRQP